jgi:hypothetical protein
MILSAELMKERIASLERANEAASKREKRKKMRTQKRRVLKRGTGEDTVTQHKTDQQLACEKLQEGRRPGLSR